MSCDSEALLLFRSRFEKIYGDRLVKIIKTDRSTA
jgi:hypothetical protein